MNLCIRFEQECRKEFLEDIRSKKFIVDRLDSSDEQKTREHVKALSLMLEIFGSNGEYLTAVDFKEVLEVDLPHRIKKIKIETASMYRHQNQSLSPSVYFEVVIDFSTGRIWDLTSSPSHSTQNESFFQVTGMNSITVLGLVAEFDAFFEKHRNFNFLINAENVYDVLLWLGFLPVTIICLLKWADAIPQQVVSAPLPLQIIFSVVVLFQILFLFRLSFNFARWFFPWQELTSQTSLKRKIAKYFYSTAVAAFVGTFTVSSCIWLFKLLMP